MIGTCLPDFVFTTVAGTPSEFMQLIVDAKDDEYTGVDNNEIAEPAIRVRISNFLAAYYSLILAPFS